MPLQRRVVSAFVAVGLLIGAAGCAKEDDKKE